MQYYTVVLEETGLISKVQTNVSHTPLKTNSHVYRPQFLFSLTLRHTFPSSQARLRTPSSAGLPFASYAPHILLALGSLLLYSLPPSVSRARQTQRWRRKKVRELRGFESTTSRSDEQLSREYSIVCWGLKPCFSGA
jgi:hypothetical protein